MVKQNLHTHSVYCDGKDTLEEMIQSAIEKKFTILGFSGHGFTPGDDVGMSLEDTLKYQKEIKALKLKYRNQIQIYLGIEQDMLYRIEHPENYDFIIGSKHYVKGFGLENGIDASYEITKSLLEKYYHNNFLEYAKDYYQDLQKMSFWNEVDIIGHVDLLMKFNENEDFISFNNQKYIQMACDAIDCFIANDKIIEVNTGAIARGYRSKPYPDKNLLAYIYEKKGKILLNSDCHNRDFLDCGYDESLCLIKKIGFTSMEVLTEDGFKSVDLKEFY